MGNLKLYFSCEIILNTSTKKKVATMSNKCIKVACASILSAAFLAACGGGGSNTPSTGNTVTAEIASTVPNANAGSALSSNVGEVVTLNGSASSDPNGGALTYKWTMTSKPVDSAVRFSDTTTAKPQLTNTMAGTYVATLIVNNGKSDSTPSNVSITVNSLVGAAPARAPIQAEVQYLIDTALTNIPLWVKSPSTFKVAETPTWAYYDTRGKPNEGAVTVKFDSQNGFGATVRTTAICPANWDTRGYWVNTMQSNLALCVFF